MTEPPGLGVLLVAPIKEYSVYFPEIDAEHYAPKIAGTVHLVESAELATPLEVLRCTDAFNRLPLPGEDPSRTSSPEAQRRIIPRRGSRRCSRGAPTSSACAGTPPCFTGPP